MSQPPELSIVLPVYNEAENIESVLKGLEAAIRTSHEVLVVYDSESDTTIPVVRRLGFANVELCANIFGTGVLGAMRTGISAARGEFVLISMADGSDQPESVDKMMERARAGADVVAASRYMPGGRQEGGPWLKGALSRFAGLSLHHLGGLPIHDATSNFRLYRRSFVETIRIESEAGFELALELTVKAFLAGRTVAEVPTIWRDRTAGLSHFQMRRWLPHYVRWYLRAFARRTRATGGRH